MSDGLCLWSGLWKKMHFKKPLGSSLDVNRMRTKRNEHAPKSGCVDFVDTCFQREILGSLLFSCLTFSPLVLLTIVTLER